MVGIRDKISIHQERILVEGIEMNLNSCNVSENLEDQAADHPDKEAPGTITDAKIELGNKAQSEDGNIECIPWK